MTALEKYQRLEAPGTWQGGQGQRRDVVASFGEATLTISAANEVAVSHWSLAAIQRLNPGERPAIFTPGPEADERLEIDDDTMITAIEQVRRSVSRLGPHPRRLRLISLAVIGLAILALALFWLPGAMISYTAGVVPAEKRAELGSELLGAIHRTTGAPCAGLAGQQALERLHARLLPDQTGRIVVVRSGALPSRHLPGGILLLNRSVVEDHESPDVTAGFILAEALRISAHDPVATMLDRLGLSAALELLTTGDLGPQRLNSYAEAVLTRPNEEIAEADLLARFDKAKVSATPYAYAVDITGEQTIGLIEADPVSPDDAALVLSDADWVSLQSICGG